jgi:hypothetical protein
VLSFDYRFLFPSVPFLFSVAAIGVGVVLGLRLPEKARLGRILMDVGVLLVCVAVSAGVLPSQNDISMKSNFATGMYQAHIPLGMHLAKFPHDEKSPILAISDAGAMPYYSGGRTIDTYGLNDPNIAISGRHDPEYVLSQNPDLLVVLSKRADTFVPLVDFEQGLYEAATAHGMVTVLVVKFFDEYYLWCLVNPASKVEEYLHK